MKKFALPVLLLSTIVASMAFAGATKVSADDPINKKCPITGKDIVAGRTSDYEQQTIGFCCQDCVGKFESDPKKYIGKVKEFKKKKAA